MDKKKTNKSAENREKKSYSSDKPKPNIPKFRTSPPPAPKPKKDK